MRNSRKKRIDTIAEANIGSYIFADVSNASTLYNESKMTAPEGHGFSAERANHLYDVLFMRKAILVGDNYLKNGADRIVDGLNIQTKFCNSGLKCISECFEGNVFRYYNADSSPMQVEVPFDMYEASLYAMEKRIKTGQVKGVNNPADAKSIVKKSPFTYAQAKNIAKAGSIESLSYDSANGMIIASSSMGISALITFSLSIWKGENPGIALKHAAIQGLSVGGIAWASAVLGGQLMKMGFNSLLVDSSKIAINLLGSDASALLANAFRSGKNIYGAAAMNNAAKILRSNTITAIATFTVLSSIDITNIFRGRISGIQLFRNMANTASSIGGGSLGWVGGATAGAMIGSTVPIIGTAAGGVVGGIVGAIGGGMAASTISNKILNIFTEDDANKIVNIIEKVFAQLCVEYLILKNEAEIVVKTIRDKLSGKLLKDMYASKAREDFAYELLNPIFEGVVSRRVRIHLPNHTLIVNAIHNVLKSLDLTVV